MQKTNLCIFVLPVAETDTSLIKCNGEASFQMRGYFEPIKILNYQHCTPSFLMEKVTGNYHKKYTSKRAFDNNYRPLDC